MVDFFFRVKKEIEAFFKSPSVSSLLDAVEAQYGRAATRLYRAFRPRPASPSSPRRWRRLCCVPYIVLYLACFLAAMAGVVLLCVLLDMEGHVRNDGEGDSVSEISKKKWQSKNETMHYKNFFLEFVFAATPSF